MNAIDNQNRKAAIKGLVNIAIVEGFVLVAVVGVFFYTKEIVHLIGGVIGSSLIFMPMFLRWHREHGNALRTGPGSDEDGDV